MRGLFLDLIAPDPQFIDALPVVVVLVVVMIVVVLAIIARRKK